MFKNLLFTCSLFSFHAQGNVYVNGRPIQENYNWYISNTGYVLQLAVPYYEELTVRQNLTLSAWVKLHISTKEKHERVEQVMDVVCVNKLLYYKENWVGFCRNVFLSVF